ncbi:DUF427 domain-containing protein [uncultured Microbacterium sp.]|uniref:DUF427 domain-containing protein n=1 Tax=uncultured Microbacterium sp. TaxID=191216 RepID=UPI0035CA08B6
MSESASTIENRPLAERSPEELAELAFSRIRIVPAEGTFEVRDRDRVIARSDAALELHETGHDVRIYFPREDVDQTTITPIDHTSFCPFKGDASDYWALSGDESGAPVAWSYPDPIPASKDIEGYIAFYETVTVERVSRN